jgi:hypothetical protein
MSNRLEQEFPPTKWLPPIAPGGAPPDLVWHYVECGRQICNQTLRNSARAVGAAVVRAPLLAFTAVRRVTHGVTRRLPARAGWRSPAQRA